MAAIIVTSTAPVEISIAFELTNRKPCSRARPAPSRVRFLSFDQIETVRQLAGSWHTSQGLLPLLLRRFGTLTALLVLERETSSAQQPSRADSLSEPIVQGATCVPLFIGKVPWEDGRRTPCSPPIRRP